MRLPGSGEAVASACPLPFCRVHRQDVALAGKAGEVQPEELELFIKECHGKKQTCWFDMQRERQAHSNWYWCVMEDATEHQVIRNCTQPGGVAF